jgi:hypothetical protein
METISYRVLFGSSGNLGKMRWPLIYSLFSNYVPVSHSRCIRGVYEVHVDAPDATLCDMLLE